MQVLDFSGFIGEKMKIVPLSDDDFEKISVDLDYRYYPETKKELQSIIKKRIREEGSGCNLNDINTSAITDMSNLFEYMYFFSGNISGWDVSNVKDMSYMFLYAKNFNCDISGWDVSQVRKMDYMFYNAASFDKDISGWNVTNAFRPNNMFYACPLETKIRKQPKFNG